MSRSAENRFWDWFAQVEQKLRDVSSHEDPLLRELSSAIQLVDPDLSFELNQLKSGVCELVITANGVRELIPLVDSLVAHCPGFESWRITAMRQRRPLDGVSLTRGDTVLSAEQLQFSLSLELRRVDITLYLDEVSNEEYYQWLETVFLMLDAAIGERDVALHVGEVFLKERDPENMQGVYSFVELPERFDSFLAESRKEIEELDAMDSSSRRHKRRSELRHQALAIAEQLEEDAKEMGWELEAAPLLTVELYYRQESSKSGEALQQFMEQSRHAVAEQIDFGSVTQATDWVHAWFDVPFAQLAQIESFVDELAQEGYQFNCELESIFLSWAEESADISSILASLDTLADAGSVLEAHRALDEGEPARAVELLEEAIEEDPENLEVRALLAYAYAKLHDNDMAEACLDELKQDVQGNAEHPTLFWNIACAYALLAEAEQACDNLRLAFALDPELRELAIKDPDLSSLRGKPEFDELLFQA